MVMFGWVRMVVRAIMTCKLGKLFPDRHSFRSHVVQPCEVISLINQLEIQDICYLVGKYETREGSVASEL